MKKYKQNSLQIDINHALNECHSIENVVLLVLTNNELKNEIIAQYAVDAANQSFTDGNFEEEVSAQKDYLIEQINKIVEQGLFDQDYLERE